MANTYDSRLPITLLIDAYKGVVFDNDCGWPAIEKEATELAHAGLLIIEDQGAYTVLDLTETGVGLLDWLSVTLKNNISGSRVNAVKDGVASVLSKDGYPTDVSFLHESAERHGLTTMVEFSGYYPGNVDQECSYRMYYVHKDQYVQFHLQTSKLGDDHGEFTGRIRDQVTLGKATDFGNERNIFITEREMNGDHPYFDGNDDAYYWDDHPEMKNR